MHYAFNICLLSLCYGDQIVVFYHAVISKKGVMAAFGFIMISKMSLVGVGVIKGFRMYSSKEVEEGTIFFMLSEAKDNFFLEVFPCSLSLEMKFSSSFPKAQILPTPSPCQGKWQNFPYIFFFLVPAFIAFCFFPLLI